MSKPYQSSVIKRFHSRALLSTEGMDRWFVRAPRHRDGVLRGIEEGHRRWVAAVREAAVELAGGRDGDGLRMLRNLLVTARPPDVVLWRHALGMGALDPFGPRDSVEGLLAAAELRAGGHPAPALSQLQAIARAAEVPVRSILPRFRNAWPVWLSLIQLLPGEPGAREMANLIAKQGAIADITTKPGKRRFEQAMSAVETVLTCRPEYRLSLVAYERLPEACRNHLANLSVVLSDRGRASVKQRETRRRNAQARRAARAGDLARQQAMQAVDRIAAARQALLKLIRADPSEPGAADSAWREVARTLPRAVAVDDGAGRAAADRALASVIRAHRARLAAVPPAPSALRRSIRPIVGARSTEWIAFLARTHIHRCRTAFPEGKGRPSTLGGRIPPALVRKTLRTALLRYRSHAAERESLWRTIGPESKLSTAGDWEPVFVAARRFSPNERDFVLAWLDSAPQESLELFERRHGKWMARMVDTENGLDHLLRRCQLRTARAFVLGLRSPERLRVAHATAIASKRNAGSRSLRSILDAAMREPLVHGRSIADRLASTGPSRIGIDATLEVLGSALDGRRLGSMFEGCGSSPAGRAAAARLLERCLRRDRGRVRRRYLEMLRLGPKLKAGVRDAIWRAACASGPACAMGVFARDSGIFLSHARKDLPPEELLVAATVQPTLAPIVAGMLDRQKLVRAMPRARILLTHRPGLRAVMELAVLSDLREMAHLRHLARVVHARSGQSPGSRLDDRYRTYELPKRSGGKRTIAVPDERLMRLQRRFLVGAFEPLRLHPAAHGFRRGRSILSNAQAHVGRPLVANVDIKGFFPSTRHATVLASCMRVDGKRISARAAKLLADICCFQGGLPTGAPTSPVLGNLALTRADAAIGKVARRNRVSYTRYADDLTFSGNDSAKRVLPFVARVLHAAGYELDARKTQLYRQGRQQLVTGLVVNDRANLRRSDRRRLRAAVDHRCRGIPVTWHGRPMDDAALSGRIALQGMIDPALARAYRARLRKEAPAWGKSK